LPLTKNDGQPVNPTAFLVTYEDLAARFGAVSYDETPIRGVWIHEGRRYEDESLRLFVDVADTAPNRAFFAEYRLVLQQRFEQIVIYIRSYPLDIV
jgi:hypothetical protein